MDDDAAPAEGRASVSDAELWTALMRGDTTAFGQLYTRHSAIVYAAAYRHLLTSGACYDAAQRAEDAAAEAFLHAWRRRADIEVSTSVRPWLIATAVNAASNRLRSDHRQRRLLARLASTRELHEPVPDVVDEVVGHQLLDLIHKTIAALPTAEAEVVSQCLVLDRSLEDVSAALGIPLGTVKSRLHRARAHLRAALRASTTETPLSISPGAADRSRGPAMA